MRTEEEYIIRSYEIMVFKYTSYLIADSQKNAKNIFDESISEINLIIIIFYKENDYYYAGFGYGNTEEWELVIWELDEDGDVTVCIDTIPCPNSNLEDFEKKWEKEINDEFHEFTIVEWVKNVF